MGVAVCVVDMKRGGGVSQYYSGFGCLIRRKQVDSAQAKGEGQQLAKRLSAFDLIAIGNSLSFSSFPFLFSVRVSVVIGWRVCVYVCWKSS